MRLLLILAIAMHLSGAPALAATPCGDAVVAGHCCCRHHQGPERGTAIWHCGCATPDQPGAEIAAVSTAAGALESHAPAMTAAVGLDGVVPAVSGLLAGINSTESASSPPPLTAVGLRC